MVLYGQELVEYSVVVPVELRAGVAVRIVDCILDLGIADCEPVVGIAVRIVVFAVVAGRFVAHLHTLNLQRHHWQEEWC